MESIPGKPEVPFLYDFFTALFIRYSHNARILSFHYYPYSAYGILNCVQFFQVILLICFINPIHLDANTKKQELQDIFHKTHDWIIESSTRWSKGQKPHFTKKKQ